MRELLVCVLFYVPVLATYYNVYLGLLVATAMIGWHFRHKPFLEALHAFTYSSNNEPINKHVLQPASSETAWAKRLVCSFGRHVQPNGNGHVRVRLPEKRCSKVTKRYKTKTLLPMFYNSLVVRTPARCSMFLREPLQSVLFHRGPHRRWPKKQREFKPPLVYAKHQSAQPNWRKKLHVQQKMEEVSGQRCCQRW